MRSFSFRVCNSLLMILIFGECTVGLKSVGFVRKYLKSSTAIGKMNVIASTEITMKTTKIFY